MLIKVFISVVSLILIDATESDVNDPDCGEMPKKTPEKCCDGLRKVFSVSSLKKCHEECKTAKDAHHCCYFYCRAKELNFLKDDQVDSETAIASLQKLVGDDEDWVDVRFMLNFFKILLSSKSFIVN